MNTNNEKKKPRFVISKRAGISDKTAWKYRIIAILVALIVNGIVITIITKMNPLDVYGTLFTGAFGSTRKIIITFKETALLLLISIALTPAFKMKFWNLGGEGQILIGAWASALFMLKLGDKMPNFLLVLIMLIASILAGAIWAGIPAVCKARWGTNESLFTLMMNYVATQFVAFFIIKWEVPKGSGHVGIINQSSQSGWLPYLGHNSYLLIIILVAILTAVIHIYLKSSKHGYEIRVVGESQSTAAYVGIPVDKVTIRTLLLSGGLCGLAGWMLVSGCDHTITTTLSGGMGFTAIMVSWLAQFDIPIMGLCSLLIVFMGQGAGEIAMSCGLNESFGDILTGIIIFFIIGVEFFVNYEVHKRKEEKEAE